MHSEESISNRLSYHNIPNKKLSFRISKDLETCRDYDWERYINSGQCLNIETLKDGTLMLIGKNANGLPMEVGTLPYDNLNFTNGIVGNLITKELTYNSGEKKKCLDFYQPIILFSADNLPDEMVQAKGIVFQAKQTTQASVEKIKNGCIGFIVLVVLLGFIKMCGSCKKDTFTGDLYQSTPYVEEKKPEFIASWDGYKDNNVVRIYAIDTSVSSASVLRFCKVNHSQSKTDQNVYLFFYTQNAPQSIPFPEGQATDPDNPKYTGLNGVLEFIKRSNPYYTVRIMGDSEYSVHGGFSY